jgi:hypothetical protein
VKPLCKPEALVLLVSVFLAAALPAKAATDNGKVRGKVIDEYNAITLPGAVVEVVGTTTLAYTDIDGVYELSVPPGSHKVKVSFSGYQEKVVEVRAEVGRPTTVDVALQLPTVQLSEQITVEGEATPAEASQAAAMLERKKAGVISEALARDEMSKNADSDAAAAMTRVTGVSVVDGQYVFVRGLGERYSNTTLNGTVLPTTEPDKRVVPLDLFPTGLIDQVRIIKSYLPDKPAEFAGGLLEIEPINFPTQATFSLSLSTGYNSQATFEDVDSYPGGGRDWLGLDDGTRSLPSVIPDEKLVGRGIFGGGFTDEELITFGRAFSNVWEPVTRSGRPDSSFSILAGNSWDRFGAVASVTYNYKNRFRSERQQIYQLGAGQQGLRPTNDFDFRYSTVRATLGAVANLAYRFSGNHRVAVENFFTNSGRDETRSFEGYQEDKGVPLRNTRLLWLQERVFSSKLSGEHFFPGLSNSRADWRFVYSRAERDEPDLREMLYEYDPVQDAFFWSDESQSALRLFSESTDKVYEGAGDWSLFFRSFGQRLMSLKVGGAWTYRDRFFSSRRLRFKPRSVSGVDLTAPPEELFVPENIGTVFRLEEDTRRTDRYDAEHTILAGYAMADVPFSDRLRLVGGARVEYSDQAVLTRDPFDPTLASIRSALENTDVLPGLNLIYGLGADTNLRLSVSQTVNRPEFRELAPYEFTDIVGGRAVVGNPDLKRALIRNADLRWEWLPQRGSADGEVIAVSAFYKDFQDPIERVVEATAQFRTSYANAKGARNLGFEVEARKALNSALLLGLNYTFVDSQIELERGTGQVQTSLDRPLAGQSGNVLNAMLELRLPGDLTARALVNWFDDRISDVGALGIPDILEEGRASVDAVITKRLGHYTLRFAGENLTNAENRYTQGGEFQRGFKVGQSVSLGMTYSR